MKKMRFHWDHDSVLCLKGDACFDHVGACLDEGLRLMQQRFPSRLDVSGVVLHDSAFLACLLAWLRFARSSGHELNVVNMPDRLKVLGALYSLNEVAPCWESHFR